MSEAKQVSGEAAVLSRAAELLLVRLLPAGKSVPGPKKLRDELARLGADLASDDAWAAALDALRSAGLLADGKKLGLTDAGRGRALRVLGLSGLPPKATWPQVRDRHLVGVAAGTPGGGDGLRTKPRLAAVMLDRRYGLDLADGATINTAAAALVCKELGFPGLSDLKALQAAVLGRLLRTPQPLPPGDAVEQFVRDRFDAKRGKVEELRRTLIAEWVRGAGADGHSPAADDGASGSASRVSSGSASGGASGDVSRGVPAPPADARPAGADESAPGADLAAFAAAARLAAEASPSGRFGDNKVFIAHAWRRLREEGGPAAAGLDLPAFKSRLVEAQRAGLLTLSRADLVAAMDPADVAESEARYLNAAFHFVLVEGGAR